MKSLQSHLMVSEKKIFLNNFSEINPFRRPGNQSNPAIWT